MRILNRIRVDRALDVHLGLDTPLIDIIQDQLTDNFHSNRGGNVMTEYIV